MINPVTDKSLGKETIEWPESRHQSFFNRLSHYHCRIIAAAAIHLRFLQTLTKVSAEKNSTMILPLPIDLLTAFLQKKEKE
jgi:hypothetical protein